MIYEWMLNIGKRSFLWICAYLLVKANHPKLYLDALAIETIVHMLNSLKVTYEMCDAPLTTHAEYNQSLLKSESYEL